MNTLWFVVLFRCIGLLLSGALTLILTGISGCLLVKELRARAGDEGRCRRGDFAISGFFFVVFLLATTGLFVCSVLLLPSWVAFLITGEIV